MALDITNTNKNNLTIVNTDKDDTLTWDKMDWTWDEADSVWKQAEIVLSKENKNNLTITNTAKI